MFGVRATRFISTRGPNQTPTAVFADLSRFAKLRPNPVSRKDTPTPAIRTPPTLSAVTTSRDVTKAILPGPQQAASLRSNPCRRRWGRQPSLSIPCEGCPAEAQRAKAGRPHLFRELRLGKPTSSHHRHSERRDQLRHRWKKVPLPRPSFCGRLQKSAILSRLHNCNRDRMFAQARFVYVLRSVRDSTRYYTGVTGNVAQRLAVHNAGGSRYTDTLRPWRLIVSLEFATELSATRFERYLKSGSGRAFSKKHFT